jgi:inner membrane protein
MASTISHAIAALSIGTCFYRPQIPRRVWFAGALCSVFPDADVIGFPFGIPYSDFWGHRGFTHSLLFAVLVSGVATTILLRREPLGLGKLSLFAFLFLATASHGLLDAMTNGGLGIAFFSPFNNDRYFLPWRPIRVSPISVTRFFSGGGYAVLQSELLWVWTPAFIFATLMLIFKRRTSASARCPEPGDQ